MLTEGLTAFFHWPVFFSQAGNLSWKKIEHWGIIVHNWLSDVGISEPWANYMKITIMLVGIAIICFLANFIAKKIILTVISHFIRRSRTNWDDILHEKKVFHRLSHYVPAIILYFVIEHAIPGKEGWIHTLQSGTYIYMIIITLLVLVSFLLSVNDIYNTLPASKNRSIKGYIQVVNIILYLIAAILIISIIIGKSPGYLLGGLGALAAVLMLVFKDSLLGLVSGIQIASNDMLRPGDWISMPSKGADGNVIDISLHTIKVQNWDKTISYIPAYSLVSESFSNWRGMEESGGRRIKRAINLDVNSIKFCPDEMLDKFERFDLLKNYIAEKRIEIAQYNAEHKEDFNKIRLTNIGTFRIYLENYLRNNTDINLSMTFIIRQMEPTESGLPIEIYVFSKKQAWADYEKVQADIFDHIYAILPEFELCAFQNPTGSDFRMVVT